MLKFYGQKQIGEENIYLACTFTSSSIGKGSQDRNLNLEAEVYAVVTKECFLLSCSLWCSQPAFLQNLGTAAQG